MTDHQYPRFETGQTLTAAELNLLQGFLHARDRLVGRMVGFGVNCGLGGAVSGTTLTIQPGLAVDQTGEPLVLPAATTIDLAPPAMTPSYDFIDTTPGGFSVVLEVTDDAQPAPDCGEANCAGHAELHTLGVALRTVAGRVTGTRMDFSDDPLLKSDDPDPNRRVEPLLLALDSTPTNSYTNLRDAVAKRLTNGTEPLVDPTLIAKLQATSIETGDTPGIKGYKCGWLNMVLFATLDLLRARALLQIGCDRTTTRAGVVLGWVHQVGGDWVVDCAYRHAWEPPRGLTEAFLGGTCANPLGRYQDAVEALLAGYAPPDPAPSGGVNPPTDCPKGSIRWGGRCVPVYLPPKTLPDKWAKNWEFDPRGPVWNPPVEETWKQPWKIYEDPGWNFFNDGVIGATDYLGHKADAVVDVLTKFISEDKRGIPDIQVVDVGATNKLSEKFPGYLPSGGFSPSDTIVLTKDTAGNVVAAGRVPAVRNTRNVGAALPAAVGAAKDAQAAATELRGLATTLQADISTLAVSVTDVKGQFITLQKDFQAYKGGTFDTSGYGVRIANAERQLRQLEGVGDRVSNVEGKVGILEKLPIGGGKQGIDATLGKGMAEFAKTTVAAMRTLPNVRNRNFQRYTAAADKARADLEAAVAADNPELIGEAALGLLDTVRTMVKASGVSREQGRQLDMQLRDLRGLIR